VIFSKNEAIGINSRFIQAKFLIKYFLAIPIHASLWMIDEIFYSDYKGIEVSPLFIIGQPRSGTTFLHRTLAEDTANYIAIRHIEWRYPYVCAQKVIRRSVWARNIINKDYWPDSKVGRLASKMHPNTLFDWEEDGIFFEERYLHHLFIFLRFPYPDLLEEVDSFAALSNNTQEKILKTHKKVIQKMLYLSGAKDKVYLAKEVTSHNKIKQLIMYYPLAKFIVVGRHADDYMTSLVALVRNSTHVKAGVDPLEIENWKDTFIDRMRKDSLMLIELSTYSIPSERQVRVSFNQHSKNIDKIIYYIYLSLGYQLKSEFLQYLSYVQGKQVDRERGYDNKKNTYDGFEEYDIFIDKVDADCEKFLEKFDFNNEEIKFS